MVIRALKSHLSKEEFYPGFLSFLTSPYYITRRSILDNISDISPSITGNILDFGCGSKPYKNLFKNAESYVGVDIEISGHDHRSSSIDYFYNGKSLPFEDRSFDSIVSFETFEHVINLSEIFPELYRVLKPGGKILVTIPFVFPEHENPYDFRRFTVNGLKSFLMDGGFEIVETRRYPSAILTIAQSYIHYLYQNFSSKNTIARSLVHFLISLPTACVAHLCSAVFPSGDDFYIGSMVVARRPKKDGIAS